MKTYMRIMVVFSVFLILIPCIVFLSADKIGSKLPQTQVIGNSDDVSVVKILDTESGEVLDVNLRDYLIGAVMGQMPADFESEALKCQAVLAHTYILNRRLIENDTPTPALNGADISTDSSSYQAYFDESKQKSLYGNNYDTAYSKISQAVDDVYSYICTYQNEPIIVAFHGMSSGYTESAENAWGVDIPYLQSIQSEWDTSVKGFSKDYIFDESEVKEIILAKYPEIKLEGEPSTWIDVTETSPVGTVLAICVGDDKKKLDGTDFMEMFGLQSPHFVVMYNEGEFTIMTCGCGHLVGMSQYGANSLAKQDKTFDEILLFYFRDIEISTLD